MKCPIDSNDLVMIERQGIEVDYCPKCRGVWLDRGELDKIIERSAAATSQPSFLPPQPQAGPQPRNPQPDHDSGERNKPRYSEQHDQRYQDTHDPRYKKRKSSFLGELFDFGD
jgi:Zn-finger nucleic acid-binding protein